MTHTMIKQHVIVCQLLAVLLCVFITNGEIIVRRKNESEVVRFRDLMSTFGPEIDETGVTGFVYPVQPRNACREVVPPPNNFSTWIAIIARDTCTFSQKVRNAQLAGYQMAIVYNEPQHDGRIHMGGDGDGITIPSVFVGWTDGQMLANNYCYTCKVYDSELGSYVVTVTGDPFRPYPYPLWPFVVVVGTCFVLMLIFMTIKWCRDFRKKRKSRLSSKHLKKIPTKKFKKGEEYDVCAICLDDYEEGDKLRLLPCSHVYHCKCIDPWLTKNKRCCPICKRKVIPGDDPSSESESEEEAGNQASSERTPLLSGNNNRRSTFDNSGLPEAFRAQSRVVNEAGGDESADTSDDSQSELGAVGGAPLPETQTRAAEQTVSVETRTGSDNSAYHSDDDVEVIKEEDYDDFDVMAFNGQSRKEETKQFNHVV